MTNRMLRLIALPHLAHLIDLTQYPLLIQDVLLFTRLLISRLLLHNRGCYICR
jgi:hypothetical protein